MIYIISYPRSGNTAFRYLLETITGKPTNGLCPGAEWNPKDRLQMPLLHSGTDYVARKSHTWDQVEDGDTVFFIIRDPLEAVIRHNEKKRGIDKVEKIRGYLDGWFALLQKYDDFPGAKILIRYEDMIKVADRASKDIYPDSQSTGPDHHKNKLSNGLRAMARLYMKEQYKYLYNKYL